MNKKQLTELTQTEPYSFLRTNPKLGKNIMLLTIGGSHAYGTATRGSDVDIRGIYAPTPKEILSLKVDDKPIIHSQTDTVIYPLKQIFNLLTNCNPNVLEILGTSDAHIIEMCPLGKTLRDNAHVFLSKVAAQSFGGYATAQLRRLQNALARDKLPQAEREQHILNSIKHQHPHIERNYPAFDDKDIQLYLADSDKTHYDKRYTLISI